MLERWYDGEQTALAALLARHHSWLHRYARQKLGRRLRAVESSEDVVQTALLGLLRSGPAFVPRDEHQFRALIGKLVLNRIYDLCDYADAGKRDKAREVSSGSRTISRIGPSAATSDRPDRQAEAAERKAMVELALELLDPEDRAVIVLRDWEGLAFDEIARRLNVETKAANKRYHRAVARLGLRVRKLRSGDLVDLAQELERTS